MDALPPALVDRVRAALASYAARNPMIAGHLGGSFEALASSQLCGLWCHGLDNIDDVPRGMALSYFEGLVDPHVAGLCQGLRDEDAEALEARSRMVFAMVEGNDELFDVFSKELPSIPPIPEDAPRFELEGEDPELVVIFGLRRVFAILTESLHSLFEADDGLHERAESFLDALDAVGEELLDNPLVVGSKALLLVEAERRLGAEFEDDRLQGLFARARHALTLCLHSLGPCFAARTDGEEDGDPFSMLRPASLVSELQAAHWAARQFHDAVCVAIEDTSAEGVSERSQLEAMRADISHVLSFATSSQPDIGAALRLLGRHATELVTALTDQERRRALDTLQKLFRFVTEQLPGHPEWGHYTRKAVHLLHASIDQIAEAFDIPKEEIHRRGLDGTLGEA